MKKYLLIVMLFITSFSFACSCIGKSKIKTSLKSADAVFVGTIISSKKVKIKMDSSNVGIDSLNFLSMMEYKISITQRIKGKTLNDTIKVYSGFGNGDCGFRFNIGQKYIVYSHFEEYSWWGKVNFLSTDICMRTMIYNDKEYKKLIRIGKRKDYS
ncbi:hypothetical protein [Flavobacterium terrae]|uniref:Tissue inhibitor of metalloproteinase n=1 Tax=Flavobacterium terrae TaxID=415425 RepID=A0A1M6HGI0_9FLAO|nr:hypothetical protein [Flavobacterium terrae]SHJ21291.1 Tissue inhibitor of metalloproteinase [Flavobacterium terrae]